MLLGEYICLAFLPRREILSVTWFAYSALPLVALDLLLLNSLIKLFLISIHPSFYFGLSNTPDHVLKLEVTGQRWDSDDIRQQVSLHGKSRMIQRKPDVMGNNTVWVFRVQVAIVLDNHIIVIPCLTCMLE